MLKGFLKWLGGMIGGALVGYFAGIYFFPNDSSAGTAGAVICAIIAMGTMAKESERKARIQKDAKYVAEGQSKFSKNNSNSSSYELELLKEENRKKELLIRELELKAQLNS